MALKFKKAESAQLTLDEHERLIWGNELLLGQIVKIGNDGHVTAFVLDSSHIPPRPNDNDLHVALVSGSGSPPPTARAFLCQGKAFVEGTETLVKVYRV